MQTWLKYGAPEGCWEKKKKDWGRFQDPWVTSRGIWGSILHAMKSQDRFMEHTRAWLEWGFWELTLDEDGERVGEREEAL